MIGKNREKYLLYSVFSVYSIFSIYMILNNVIWFNFVYNYDYFDFLLMILILFSNFIFLLII